MCWPTSYTLHAEPRDIGLSVWSFMRQMYYILIISNTEWTQLSNAIVIKTFLAHHSEYYAIITIVPAQTFHAFHFNPFLQLPNFHHCIWEERAEVNCGQSMKGIID
jgi:hypothetical protein